MKGPNLRILFMLMILAPAIAQGQYWPDEVSFALYESASQEVLFRMLKKRYVSAMFSLPIFFTRYLGDNGIENLALVENWFPDEKPIPHCLVLSRSFFGRKEANAIQGILEDMKKDGTIQGILARHLSDRAHHAILIK